MIEKFQEYRQKAIDALRQSGSIVLSQASEIIVRVITDRIEAVFDEESGYSLKIDGKEIGDVITKAHIEFLPGTPPTIRWETKPKGIPLTAEEESELQKYSRNPQPHGKIPMPCSKGQF